jgi:sugar-specific transcriptional regulator TrmB
MDIKKLQEEVNSRWSKQLDNPCHRSADPNHALIHMTKALGKLSSALNDAEHEQRIIRSEEVAKYLADLVICASRFGDGIVDLDVACIKRLNEKFPVHNKI